MPVPVAVCVDMPVLRRDGGYGVEYAREDVMKHAGAHRCRRRGQDFHKERPRVEANAERAAGKDDGDDGRTQDLELAIPVGVLLGWWLAREAPTEEGDEVPDEVFMGTGGDLQLALS